jgi:hypothetical protein
LGYELFDVIAVRVTAHNEKGSSITPSAKSTGLATARVVPQAVQSNVIYRGNTTTENLLHVIWTPLTADEQTGQSTILSYNVEYQVGGVWVSVVGESTHYT